jgi:hypothetical protein
VCVRPSPLLSPRLVRPLVPRQDGKLVNSRRPRPVLQSLNVSQCAAHQHWRWRCAISPPIPRHEQHPRNWRTPNTASGGSRKNARESALASDRGRPESPRCCAAPDPPLLLEVRRPRLHQPCLAWRGVPRGRGEASASCPCLYASSQDATIAAVQRVGDP